MDYLLINGEIFTMDNEKPVVQALAIKNDRIIATGTTEEIKNFKNAHTKVIDLDGRTVIPGLNDSHLHFYSTGLYLDLVDLMGSTSIHEVKEQVRRYINERNIKPGTWIRGRGWNQEHFTDEKRFITRQDLDDITTDHPLLLYRTCGHVLIANSKAIEMAELEKRSLEGHYDLHHGIFKEQAIESLLKAIPDPTFDDIKRTIQRAARHANRYGITSVQADDLMHLPSQDYRKILKAYETLQDEGQLTCRIYQQAQLPNITLLKDFLNEGYTTGVGNEYFKIGPLKLLGDGSLGARTAALRKPYHDDPKTKGILNYTDEELRELIETAHTNHMQLAIHGIGDRTIDQILNIYEDVLKRYPRNDHRHGIVHAQIMDEELMNRMKKLNVLAYVQPIFINYDHLIVESRVGPLVKTSYAYKTMKELGIHMSFGTDSPVEKIYPLDNIYSAVTRKGLDGTPLNGWMSEEAVTVYDAVYAYTVESAYAEFMEHEKGKLKPNYFADLIILDQNIFNIDPEKIRETEVLLTMVGGQVVYKK